MVKAEIKTPNKRKSLANNTPAKKIKSENGKPFTPKKAGSPQKPASPQKPNKQIKSENGSEVKDVKPFAGTKQFNKQKPKPQQTLNKKPQNAKAANNQSPVVKQEKATKKKRRSQFSKLISEVKEKPGSKDADLLKSLQDKIDTIIARGELTKTAKKKVSMLKKLQIVCQEGAEAAAAQSRAKVAAERAAAGKVKEEKAAAKPGQQQKKKQPQVAKAAPQKKQPVKQEEEDDDEDDSDAEEEESDEEAGAEEDSDAEGEEEEDSGEEVEGEEDDDDSEDDEEDDDDSEEEAPAPPPAPKETKKLTQQKPADKGTKNPTIQDLKNKDLVKKGQKRFVLFLGNIPYDTTQQEIAAHFQKAGDIVHIRIPTEEKTNRPRGFAYLELRDEVSYEKCLSMHHSMLKNRQINVLYTQGGKKKGDQQKKDIKAKNMKLHALRKRGQLAGSVKETNKRSFRRNKAKQHTKQD